MAVAHAGGLLGGKDDVAVVGQHHYLVGPQTVDGLEKLRGARVHGLATVDDRVDAKRAEELFVTLARYHCYSHRARRPAGAPEPRISLFGLLVHVVDLDLAESA